MIEHDGAAAAGVLEIDTIELEDGARVEAAAVQRWLPPVVPTKIVATHLTYRSRATEYAMAQLPQAPSYFLKPPSPLSAHGAPVYRPRGCRFLNYEGEIAVVIGARCSSASLDDALSHVPAHPLATDWGVRACRHADRASMLRVKGQDGFCPLGP